METNTVLHGVQMS